jgi:hypothetical protein
MVNPCGSAKGDLRLDYSLPCALQHLRVQDSLQTVRSLGSNRCLPDHPSDCHVLLVSSLRKTSPMALGAKEKRKGKSLAGYLIFFFFEFRGHNTKFSLKSF